MKKARKSIKKIYDLCKKTFGLFLVICIGLTSINFNFIMPVLAGELGQEITLIGGTANGDYIEFYEGETLMGKVQVKIGDNVLTPYGNKVILPEFDEIYQVGFYITYEEGYEARSYNVGEINYLTPGEGAIYVSVTSGNDFTVTFNFEELAGGPGPGMPPFAIFPILAYFSEIAELIETNMEGNIIVPADWISGTVSFKAKICESDGEIVPNDGVNICDLDTEALMDLNIQGINNRNQINNSVWGSENNENIIVNEDFQNYGKVGIHLTNENINTVVDVITENLINISATAPMRMDYS